MTNLLAEILRRKREDLTELLRVRAEDSIRNNALRVRAMAEPHRLRKTLAANNPEFKIIAEYKRRSPSKGNIREDLHPAEAASLYQNAGACAISVLTEKHFFGGSIDDLLEVRATTALPVLRKDFTIHPVQLFEAAEAGADAILLIAAALDEETLGKLRSIAEEDNRDLTTFDVSLSTSEALVRYAPENALLISESGLRTGDELSRLRALGFDGFLIGGSLMQSDNPGDALRKLLEGCSGDAITSRRHDDAN
jgi:indole-3-glycerol phosphate synthase